MTQVTLSTSADVARSSADTSIELTGAISAVEAELVNVDVERRAVGCQPGYRCLGGELIPCPPGSKGDAKGERCLLCEAGTYQRKDAEMTCEACPYGSYCGVGTAAPTACPDGYFGGAENLTHVENCTVCEPGYWCSAGKNYSCNEGFYNEATGSDDPETCMRCPEQSTTDAKGSTSRTDCKCAPKYFAAAAADAAEAEAGTIRCEICTSSMDCTAAGSTVGALLLKPGWWRLSNASKQVYRCASFEHCPPPNASEAASRRRLEGSADASRERWGVGGRGCRVGHRGPLCAKCEPGWAVGFDGLCEQCTDEVRTRSLTTIAVGGVLFVIAVVVILALMVPRTKKKLKRLSNERAARSTGILSSRRSGRSSKAFSESSASKAESARRVVKKERSVKKKVSETWARLYVVFSPKVKIVWSMLQMLTLLGICFGVQWPAQYEEVVRAVEEGVNLNFLKLVTVSCWQEWTWHHTLVLRTVVPTALYLLCMGFVALAWLAKRCKRFPDGTLATLALELIGTIIFLAYPSTSATVFSAFVPRSFDCGGGECDQPETFLAADLGVEYYSEEHAFWQLYAWLMIAIWPLGVPAFMILMFWRNRKGLAQLRNLQISYDAQVKIDERSGKAVSEVSILKRSVSSIEAHDNATKYIMDEVIKDRRWIEGRLKHYELRCAWFDVVEIARKLLLTGFAVLLEQGSMGQLVAGCLLASAMLALTALLQPYKHLGDDMLAIGCQAAVVANLALAIMLHARRSNFENELLENQLLRTGADEAADEEAALKADEERVAHGLIAAAVTPIVGAIVLAVVQLRPPGGRLAARVGLRRRISKYPKAPPSAPSAPDVRVVGAGGLVWSKPPPPPPGALQRAPSTSALQQAPSAEGALARQPSLLRDLSGCHRPPPSGPPAIERWKSAGLAAQAISRLEMEATARQRVERARASMTERQSSMNTGELIGEEISCTSRMMSMRL